MGSDRRRCRLHHGPLDDDAGGRVPPQGDEQLARQGDDSRLAHPPAKAPDPLVEPRLSAEAGWFCSHSQASSTMLALADQFRSYDGPGETESPPATAGLFATELLLNRA